VEDGVLGPVPLRDAPHRARPAAGDTRSALLRALR
jgi:hypothetical protein